MRKRRAWKEDHREREDIDRAEEGAAAKKEKGRVRDGRGVKEREMV